MAVCNLIGHSQHYDIIDTVKKLAEKLCVNVYCFNLTAYVRFFIKVLLETNVNISK